MMEIKKGEDFADLASDVYAAFEALRTKLGKSASPLIWMFNEDTGEFIIHAQSHYRKTVFRFLKSLPAVHMDSGLEEKVMG